MGVERAFFARQAIERIVMENHRLAVAAELHVAFDGEMLRDGGLRG